MYSDYNDSPRDKFNKQPQETQRPQQRSFPNTNQRFPQQEDYRTKMQLSKTQYRNCNGYGHYQRDCTRQAPAAQLPPQQHAQNLASPPNLAFKGNNYNAAMLYARPSSQNKA